MTDEAVGSESRLSNSGARRRRLYALNTAVLIAAAVGVVVVINVLVARADFRTDLTATRENTLAGQTAAVLADLSESVEISAFFVERAVAQNSTMAIAKDRLDSLLNQFEDAAAGDIDYAFIDPELEPGRARDKQVNQFPVIVVEGIDSGHVYTYFPSPNLEQDLLTAVLVATGTGERQVYFLTGHGERSIVPGRDGDAGAFGLVREGLEADNYVVTPWNLAREGSIPNDAAAVVVAGPTVDLLEEEVPLLDAYLKDQGRLLLLLDPFPAPTWQALLQQWGLLILDGFVIDVENSLFGSPSTLLVEPSSYSPSRITNELDVTYFPGLAPIDLAAPLSEMPNLVGLTALASSSGFSFAGLDPERTQPDPGELLGPFPPAVIIEAVAPVTETIEFENAGTTTFAVFGDSDFASNRHFVSFSNGSLLLNTINELTGDFALIEVRARPFLNRQMVITESDFGVIRIVGWFILPLIVALAGMVVWWRRR